MNDSKLSVNQIIEAIKMLTTSEYNEFVSKLASLQRPEDSIDAYIEEPCELRKKNYQEKAALFLNYVLTATLSEGCRDVANLPALPK